VWKTRASIQDGITETETDASCSASPFDPQRPRAPPIRHGFAADDEIEVPAADGRVAVTREHGVWGERAQIRKRPRHRRSCHVSNNRIQLSPEKIEQRFVVEERWSIPVASIRRNVALAFQPAIVLAHRPKEDRREEPFPYILAVHQAPTDGAPHPEAHLHAELYPAYRMRGRLKYLADSEIGAGVFTTDTLPEDAVKELQRVPVDVDA